MATNNKYSTVLLELKTHYQETLAELEAQTIQLKTKITSLDTLIEDPLLGSDILSILQGEANSIESEAPGSTVANTVEPKAKAKKTTQKAASNKKPKTQKKSASTAKTSGTVETKAEATPKTATSKASPSTSMKKPSTAKKAASQRQAKKKKQAKATKASSSSRPMQWPYTEMFKTDAIAQIMQEKAGTSVHVDDLVLQLYGELSGDDLKTERDRVYKTMQSGVYKNRWRKDPKESMSYFTEEKSQAKPEAS
ncbi:hypothetical protein [Acaryochloris sp. CCMEE 5410]|uniref:hypothetical protein n=1 Tax=Acaryochloris sp. CCMEE 5410 TaxID=310037 RepID=UPI0021CE2F8D|nr:hypothetical protein [Acaryochloris sp. CCMEE 5410]KAI9129234.1 hypothetical protein ON05_034300 [Acaryochloris sp. CCMEE 5410]